MARRRTEWERKRRSRKVYRMEVDHVFAGRQPAG